MGHDRRDVVGHADLGGDARARERLGGLFVRHVINGVPDVGFASPILYGIAANPTAYAASFNDITTGDNDNYGLDSGLVFAARTGYDMASGLGSPQLTSPGGGIGLAYYMCQYGANFSPPAVTYLTPTFGPPPVARSVR